MSALDSIKEMGQGKIIALGGVALLLLGFFAFLALRSDGGNYTPLYTGLAMEDSAQIIEELEKTGVPYQLQANGSIVAVPTDQVLRLRVNMAKLGLPGQGNIVGYEIFDRSDALGTSNFVHNVNMLRALEGELARTISSFQGIESARVHLVMPKRELFSREKQVPTASVAVTLRGGNTLAKEEIAAIRHLIATAVPDLQPTQVTIVDNRGRLLARGGADENDLGMMASTAAEYRIALEHRLQVMVEGLVEKIVGPGKVRAEVSAELDFNRVVRNSETFDPESQVARSVQTSEEQESSSERDVEQNVSVANQLPDPPGGEAGTMGQSNRSLTDEVINYEISKVVENHVRESGSIKKLSVAVLVDGTYTEIPLEGEEAEEGATQEVYQPRSDEQLDKIATLVRSAIGYDVERGDSVEVVNMQFSERVDAADTEGPFSWLRDDLQGIIQTLVLGVVAILAILLIVRPIVNRVIEVSMESKVEDEEAAEAERLALMGPDLAALTDQSMPDDEEMVDIERIQGKVRSATIKRVQDIIENNPDEALITLRTWLQERPGGAS